MSFWDRLRLNLAALRLKLKLPTMDGAICPVDGEILEADGRCPHCGDYWGPMP